MGATITDPLVGRLVDGRYEVVSRIARGGMATVYLAVDRRLDRDVALKVMHAHLAEGTSGTAFIARFRREARAAARLTHPGLVAVLDQGVDGEMSYLTMEYVDGTNLRRHLEEQGSLTVGDALRMIEQILDALAAAHRADLVHRDVKPENVLIAADGRVKVADFGLARAVTEVTATATGTVLGTVAYLAPELVSQGSSDARTDVYACGVLLYELLTGRQPFTGETPIQVAFQHVNNDISAPSELVGWLPAEVDELVGALAARVPGDRPVHAGAALDLVRRTRACLDEATLARRADVDPTITLPAATDPGNDDPGSDDDPAATTRLTMPASGSTVALPIGTLTAPGAGPTGDDGSGSRRGRRRRWAVAAAALVVLLTAGSWWFVTAGPGAYTTVPPVLGLTEAEAVTVLTDAGLGSDPVTAYDDDAEQGTVFRTDPDEGGKVRKDGTVTLTVSLGPDLVVVPGGLVGAMQADAFRALEEAGLVPETADGDHYSDTAPTGSVLEASAEAEAQLKRGSTVVLTLSSGPAPVTLFSVVGASQEDATSSLEGAGLKVAVETAFSDDVKKGLVISQSPAADATGHRGDTVTLTVSDGPELVEVPNLFGKSFPEAEKALSDLGLLVKREDVFSSPSGRVLSQSIGAGEKVKKGTVVTLKVV